MNDITYEEAAVVARVGAMSLIGVMGTPPVAHGNYFSLWCGIRIVNMWAENLEDAAAKFLKDGLVKIRYWKDHDVGIIIDDRIPAEYFYDNLCFTGCGRPATEVILEMLKFRPIPEDRSEEYTNPRLYHARRGNYASEDGSQVSHGAFISPEKRAELTAYCAEFGHVFVPAPDPFAG